MRLSSQISILHLWVQTTSALCRIPSLYTATIDDLITGLTQNCFTSTDLVLAYTSRILEVNTTLHALIELNPDALSIAASLDLERANGNVRSPLHGIPIVVKDNIATDDKMNNTAGSYALLGARVPRDSGVVERLRRAGTVVLGKSNMSQWAMYRATNTTSGWTARAGQGYGAYYPLMDPYVGLIFFRPLGVDLFTSRLSKTPHPHLLFVGFFTAHFFLFAYIYLKQKC